MTGDTIKREREKNHMTQEALAHELGMSQQMLSKIETGERFIKTDKLIECARMFDVSPAYLLTGNTDENRMCASDDLGLSDETISLIRHLNRTNKLSISTLETIINFSVREIYKLMVKLQGVKA